MISRFPSRRPPSRRPCAILALTFLLASSSVLLAQAPEASQIPPGPYRIAGRVVNAKNGAALARSRVTIADARNRQSTLSLITEDDGRYEFRVPAGKFSLTGAKRGFITAAYNQHDQFSTAIVTGAGLDTENLTLRLAPNAVLTGRVLDEYGEPVRNAPIMVYRENHFSGVSRVTQYRGGMTDDQGKYEVTPLDAGTYFVSVKATPWYAVHPVSSREPNVPIAQVDPSLDVAYPVTYYGDATEPEDAAALLVRGGDRLEADIHLSPAPALHLTFRVVGDGTQVLAWPTLEKSAFDGTERVDGATMQQVSDGVYEMTGIAAGRYMVRMPDSTGQLKAPTEMNLSGGQELDAATGNSTSKVKATVEIAGVATLPSHLQIGLRNSKGRVIAAEVDEKGVADFQDVIPGKYDVVAGSMSQVYSITSIASPGGTTSGHTFNIPAGASLEVSLSLVGGSVTAEGFAKQAGKAAPGAMIVLVPKNPESNRDRFRRDQSDLDGSFTLPNVTPGSYTIIAIDDGWDLDWAKAAVLSRYLEHGQTIVIKDHSPTSMRLPDPVEVQAR